MTRVIREGKRRRTPMLVFALLAVMAGVLIGGGSFSAAAPPTDGNVADYSQCAQGAPGTAVPPTGTSAGTCVQGWINGILQGSNSQYSEDQVTAQRLVIDLPRGGSASGRTITLKYLWNKGTNHAYDSLALWNTTINWLSADGVCAGVPGTCPVTSANYNNGLGTSAPVQVPSSVCSDNSILKTAGQGDHQLSDRRLVMYGGTIDSIDAPVNDSSTCSTSADEYETVVIHYHATSTPPTRVMLLFGGHLAAGGGARSWGAGLGSSAINGGPYHIKLTGLDTASIGNRDNQISSGAILPLSTGVTTLLHQTDGTNTGKDVSPANNGDPTTGALTVKMPAAGGGVYVTDFATVTPTGATGTVDFRYYSGATASADCSAATLASEGGNDAGTGKTLNASGVAQSTEIHFSSIDTIYWRAFFHGSDISNSSSSACSSEILTVQQNTTTATTLHQVTDSGGATDVNPSNNGDPITVPINAFVKDVAQLTPGSATGSVAFRLYSGTTAQTDCGNDTAGTGGADEGGGAVSATGAASSSVYHATSAGTFYWKAFFTGTGGNNKSASSCEKLIVAKASPTVASAPWLVPQDAVTIAGIASGGTTQATVTFDLFPPSNSTCSTGGTAAVYHEVVNVNGDNTYSTSNSGNSPGGFRLTSSTTTSPLGVYHWHVVYSGDEANNANDRGCVEAFNFQGVTDQAAG